MGRIGMEMALANESTYWNEAEILKRRSKQIAVHLARLPQVSYFVKVEKTPLSPMNPEPRQCLAGYNSSHAFVGFYEDQIEVLPKDVRLRFMLVPDGTVIPVSQLKL